MDISIIIVNFNTKGVLYNCLLSIYKQVRNISFEVIVSDNGSTDGSNDMVLSFFPQVIFIENKTNIGFGAANNKALKIAQGKYILYLNSDTVLLNNAVKYFFDYWKNYPGKENLGALGTNLQNEEGETIHSSGQFPHRIDEEIKSLSDAIRTSIKIFAKKKLFNYKPSFSLPGKQLEPYFVGTVDYITGADLFMKNSQDAVFDEHYMMYFEDADLQLQLAKKGKIRCLIEGPKIYHRIGGSQALKMDEIHSLSTFSSIQYSLSRYKKNSNHPWKVRYMKILTFVLWCHPWLFPETRRYLKKLMEI